MADNYQIIIEPIISTKSLKQQLNKGLKTTGVKSGSAFSEGFLKETQNVLKNRVKYALADTIISGFSSVMKSAVSNVIELDSAMTELKKVTSYTADEYSAFIDKAYNTGSSVARTGKYNA